MRISVPVNHNYYEEAPILESALGDAFSTKKSGIKNLHQLFSSVYELKLGDEQLKQIKIFKLKRNRYFESDADRLILKLYCKERLDHEKEYYLQTGLYAGVLFYKGCKFNITTKYGETFLKRMLNFVNDIYVDTEQLKAKMDETESQFLFIIAYLFLQSLEKAAVLGLPQQYKRHQVRSHKVRGSIDIADYIKRDIPFQGKLTTTFRDRIFVQEIIDILFLALRKLERSFGIEINARLLGLQQVIKQNYSGRVANYESIQKAKSHQVLNNPLYSSFKNVLAYAEIILLGKDLMPENEIQHSSTSGYLFDIAELYELYLEKLLRRNFPEWSVNGQEELPIYQDQFFGRSMFPDIVMKHRARGNVVVFDAKFKKMELRNTDVDRADLHQIHSYSGYYRNNLITSGLIYPLSKEMKNENSHSKSIYGTGENEIDFMIDGVYVSENQSLKELIKNEESFIKRISDKINKIHDD